MIAPEPVLFDAFTDEPLGEATPEQVAASDGTTDGYFTVDADYGDPVDPDVRSIRPHRQVYVS